MGPISLIKFMPLIIGLLIPLLGTMLGSAMVFFMTGEMPERLQKGLLGFASGVMVAAAVWSLLLPCIEMGASAGKWAVAPAAVGFLLGVGFLLIIDELTPHLHVGSKKPPAIKTNRDSFTNGLGTILHRACIPLWTGAPLISSLLGSYQVPISPLSALLASQRRSSAS